MIDLQPFFISNGVLAVILLSFWNGHVMRYKMKMLNKIAALDNKINLLTKIGHYGKRRMYTTERDVLKEKLYQYQKFTNYSGFR